MDDRLIINLRENERNFRRKLEVIFEKYSHPFEDAPIVDLHAMTCTTKSGERKWNPEVDLQYIVPIPAQSHHEARSERIHDDARSTSINRKEDLQMEEHDEKAMQYEDKWHTTVENVNRCKRATEKRTMWHAKNPVELDESENSFDGGQSLVENDVMEDTSTTSVEMASLLSTPPTNHHEDQLLKCFITEISPEGSRFPVDQTTTETSPASCDEAGPADLSSSTIGEVYPYMLVKLSKLIAKDSNRQAKHPAKHHQLWKRNVHLQTTLGRTKVAAERKRLDAATRIYSRNVVKMWHSAESEENDDAMYRRMSRVVCRDKRYVTTSLHDHSSFKNKYVTSGGMDVAWRQHDSEVIGASQPPLVIVGRDQALPVAANTLGLHSLTFPKAITASIPMECIIPKTHYRRSHREELGTAISHRPLDAASRTLSSPGRKCRSVTSDHGYRMMHSENNSAAVATQSMQNPMEAPQGHRVLWPSRRESTHAFAPDDARDIYSDERSYAPSLSPSPYNNIRVSQEHAFQTSDVASATSLPSPVVRNLATMTNSTSLYVEYSTECANSRHVSASVQPQGLGPSGSTFVGLRSAEAEDRMHPLLLKGGPLTPLNESVLNSYFVEEQDLHYDPATLDKGDCGGRRSSHSDRRQEASQCFLNPVKQAHDPWLGISLSPLQHRPATLSWPTPRSDHRHTDRVHFLRAEAVTHSKNSHVQTNTGPGIGNGSATREHSPGGRERQMSWAGRPGMDILAEVECSPVRSKLSLMSLRSPGLTCRPSSPRRTSRISDAPLDSLQAIEVDHQVYPCSPRQTSSCLSSGLRSPVSNRQRENRHRTLTPRKLCYSNSSDGGKDGRSHHLFSKSQSKLL